MRVLISYICFQTNLVYDFQMFNGLVLNYKKGYVLNYFPIHCEFRRFDLSVALLCEEDTI